MKSLTAHEDEVGSTLARPRDHLRKVQQGNRGNRQLQIRADPIGRTVYYPDAVRSFGSCGKPGCCPDGTPRFDYNDQCENNQAVTGEYIFTNPLMGGSWNYDTNQYEGRFIDWCNNYSIDSTSGLPIFKGCGDEAANSYCQSLNYARAEWEVKSKMQVPNTFMMGMGNQGNGPTPAGDYIYQVKCIQK